MTAHANKQPMIHIEGLGKAYHIGARRVPYKTFRESLSSMIYAPIRRAKHVLHGQASAASDLTESFWALRGVGFDVREGEVVGIIGRNGAGKSTLLKILSRITEPGEGFVVLNGRVGALLEVGTGFHPELTGRENVYLNGAILGMSRSEIARKFDEIIDFAEIERFVDTPVKHFSTGMGLRLGFAVAASLEPEILIVDEVLAVGDARFQKKCLGKMTDVAQAGRTVLFVSHNMAAIQSLCGRAIWLDLGHVIEDGTPDQVIAHYLRSSVTAESRKIWSDRTTAPGNEVVRLRSISIRPENGGDTDQISCATPLTIRFEYWTLKPGSHLHLTAYLQDQNGIVVFSTRSISDPNWHGRPFPVGLFASEFRIPGDLLNDGTHSVSVRFVQDQANSVYYLEGIASFEVADLGEQGSQWFGKRSGVVRPRLLWTTQQLADDPA